MARFLRFLITGAALLAADMLGIGFGAILAFMFTGAPNQIWLQLPIAVWLTWFIAAAWFIAIRLLRLEALTLAGAVEGFLSILASILLSPVIFVPLHYVTQGYVTSIGNLISLATYQFFVNAVVVFAAMGACSAWSRRALAEAAEPAEARRVD